MNPADESSVRSLLDKPLGELTEEDIAQLTREDCRRFLKQKGMRRPSWNKSQAIQQVISLKALLEDRPDFALRKAKKSVTPPAPSPKETSPPVSVPATRAVGDPSPYRRRDPNPNPISNPIPQPAVSTCAASAAPVIEVVAGRENPLLTLRDDPAQMTIFYGGRVNVYNDVPIEKARAIMQIAAAPLDLNRLPPEPGHPSRMIRPGFSISPVVSGPPEWIRPRECEDSTVGYTVADCPTSRQASLQRYREKRKDRYKGKRIIGGSPLSTEMMFLSQKFRGQTPDEQSSLSNTSSPTQPRPPCTPTRCSSVEKQAQKFRISVDLNDDCRQWQLICKGRSKFVGNNST